MGTYNITKILKNYLDSIIELEVKVDYCFKNIRPIPTPSYCCDIFLKSCNIVQSI